MFPPRQDPVPQRDQRSMLTRSVEHAINIAAAAVSLFGGMALYDVTHDWVRELAVRVYGPGDLAVFISTLLWGTACFALVFFVARASLFAFWMVLAAVGLRYGIGFAF